jgi:hypothetical protein
MFDTVSTAILRNLCEALRLANTADADCNPDTPSDIASQHGAFGHIARAITSVLASHGYAMPSEVNWGGHGNTWFDDLVFELTHI